MTACYGQPQYSTMSEGRQMQWADRQASDHCPLTVFIASNNGCFHRKTLKQHLAPTYLAEVKYVSAKVIIIHSQFYMSAIAVHIVETISHIHNGHDNNKDNDN